MGIVFDINNSRDFLSKLEMDYADFKVQPDSARHALNCIITAYHLKDWVWRDLFEGEGNEARRCINNFANKLSFEGWLESSWHRFKITQSLANGAKHMNRMMQAGSDRIDGYGCGPYGIGPFGSPYLLIDLGEDKPLEQRWLTAEELVDESVAFWQNFFR